MNRIHPHEAHGPWCVLRYTLSDIPNRVKINLHTSGLCTVHEILINILQTVHSIRNALSIHSLFLCQISLPQHLLYSRTACDQPIPEMDRPADSFVCTAGRHLPCKLSSAVPRIIPVQSPSITAGRYNPPTLPSPMSGCPHTVRNRKKKYWSSHCLPGAWYCLPRFLTD